MSKILFQIPIEPMSLNHTHRIVKFGKRASRIKKTEFVAWEKEFLFHLNKLNDKRTELLKYYNETKHSLILELFFYLPKEKFYTKKNTISKKSGDISNMVKTTEDQIFNWLGIDDSQVQKLVVEKIPTGEKPQIQVMISLTGYPELFLIQPQSF